MKRRIISILLTAVMVLGLIPAAAVSAFSQEEPEVVITPWIEFQSLINSASNTEETTVRLTENLTAVSTDGPLVIPTGKKIVLDLNGFVLDRGLTEKKDDGCVIIVSYGSELTINDSNPDRDNGKYRGGVITGGNNKKVGGGIWINGGKVTMNAGTIAGNYTLTTNGAGVALTEKVGFNGPDLVISKAVFEMNGGTITDNYAYSGGAVSASVNSAAIFTGGTITGNLALKKAGGVYVGSSTTDCRFGGTVQICDNFCYYKGEGNTHYVPDGPDDPEAVRIEQNVYLAYLTSSSYSKFGLADVKATTMRIGLTEEHGIDIGKNLVIAEKLDPDFCENIDRYVKPDNGDYCLNVDENNNVILKPNEYQVACDGIEHGTVESDPVSFAVKGFDDRTDNRKKVTLTVFPDEDYVLKNGTLKVICSGDKSEVAVTPDGINTFTFVMPADNVTVSARFWKPHVHSFDGDFVTGTGENAGKHAKKCTVDGCDEVGFMNGEAPVEGYTDCTYNRAAVSDSYKKSDATCLSAAVYYKSCVCGGFSDCGDTFTNGDALSHSYTGAYKDNGDGTHSRKCVNGCGGYGTASAHTGMGDFVCDHCGYTDTAAKALAKAKSDAAAALDAAAGAGQSEEMKKIVSDAKAEVDKAKTTEEVERAKQAGLARIEAQKQADVPCPKCGRVHPENCWGKIVCFFNRVINWFKNLF